VDHRARNALAVVQALLALTPAEGEAAHRFAAAVTGRVAAMARAHALLSRERWRGAELRALLAEELAPYTLGWADRVRLEGPPLHLTLDAAQPFSMVLHELATNAAKYGALSVPSGRLDVGWEVPAEGGNGTLTLRWIETGAPPPPPTAARAAPVRQGFGSRLVERSLRQLGGDAAYEWRPEGLRCTLRVPAERLSGGATAQAAAAATE
jgi:two-component sensor histidine kinase